MLIKLPFQIVVMTIRMIFQLLPYAVKYAPLALLFVDNTTAEDVDYFVSLPYTIDAYPLASGTVCVLVDTAKVPEAEELIRLTTAHNGSLILVGDESAVSDRHTLQNIYTYTKQQCISFGCDEQVLAKMAERREYV